MQLLTDLGQNNRVLLTITVMSLLEGCGFESFDFMCELSTFSLSLLGENWIITVTHRDSLPPINGSPFLHIDRMTQKNQTESCPWGDGDYFQFAFQFSLVSVTLRPFLKQ